MNYRNNGLQSPNGPDLDEDSRRRRRDDVRADDYRHPAFHRKGGDPWELRRHRGRQAVDVAKHVDLEQAAQHTRLAWDKQECYRNDYVLALVERFGVTPVSRFLGWNRKKVRQMVVSARIVKAQVGELGLEEWKRRRGWL